MLSIFQEVNNCLEFMCEILKVYVHRHMFTDYLVILEDLDVLKINEIDEICEIPVAYKDVNGVIYSLTPEVCTMLGKFRWYSLR
jgi:hypothetical protein